jgi:hypothetical protein
LTGAEHFFDREKLSSCLRTKQAHALLFGLVQGAAKVTADAWISSNLPATSLDCEVWLTTAGSLTPLLPVSDRKQQQHYEFQDWIPNMYIV